MNERWIFDDAPTKLGAIGVWEIENGTENSEAVARSRQDHLPVLASRLGFEREDVVVDLGSGMGFMAEIVAPLVKSLYCVDISPSFLADAKARLDARGVRNVEYILTDYADFAKNFGRRVTKIYSMAVFIHFNYYDLLYYLVECNRILTDGGLLYFDFNDGDRFLLHDPKDAFNSHIPLYKSIRKEWILNCMHMGSLTVLRNIAPQVGFRIEANYYGSNSFSQVLMRKIGDAVDLQVAPEVASEPAVMRSASRETPSPTVAETLPASLRHGVRKVLPASLATAISRRLANRL